jgi:hypothetical protein
MAVISRVTVTQDGILLNTQGLKRFQPNAIERRAVEDEMDGDDVVELPKKYGFTLAMAAKSGADLNLRDVKDATFVVQYEGGERVTYTGVSTLTETINEIDGKTGKEVVIAYHARGRKPA